MDQVAHLHGPRNQITTVDTRWQHCPFTIAGVIRNPGIDLVRIVGVLAIVAGHIWFDEPFHALVFAWHVPVFFFISGWLWKPRPMRQELATRSRSLLKPYVFWFVALYVAYVPALVADARFSGGLAFGPIYGGRFATEPFTTFWFVFALFAAAILWQAVVGGWWKWPVLAFALVASVAFGPQLASTPLAIGSALPALLFIAAGAWLRRLDLGNWTPIVALIAGLLGLGLVLMGIAAPFNIKGGDWGTPIVSVFVAVVISWAMVVLAQLACRNIPASAASAITGFALCGFTIVLAHPAVLWVLRAWPNLALFTAAIILPTAVALIAIRTPMSQWVTGAPKRVTLQASRA